MPIGTDFLTSNLNIAYPFREDNLTLSRVAPAIHGAAATLPIDLIVDAHFSMPSAFTGPFFLSSITALGSMQYRFTFSDGVIQATDVINITGWYAGPTFVNISPVDAVNGVYGKAVLYAPSVLAYVAGTVGTDVFTDLRLEESVVVSRNACVETFELYTALPPVPAPNTPGPITGEVQLESGYNVATEATAADGDVTEINLTATPQGQAPCTHADSQYVKGLMQLLPDENGNIQITSGDDGCYSLVVVTPSLFQLQGTCAACCSCDDYKNVATALELLLQRSKLALDTLHQAHNDPTNGYTAGVTAFNTIIAPRYMLPAMIANGHAGAAWCKDPNVRSGSLHLAAITISLKHNWRYKYLLVPTYTFVTAGMIPTVSLREWSTTLNGVDEVVYRGPLTPLVGFNYGAVVVNPALKVLSRGNEIQHRLLVQVPYYDGAPITWMVQIAAVVSGSNDGINPVETITLTQNMVFT